jgi:hypothetical protein
MNLGLAYSRSAARMMVLNPAWSAAPLLMQELEMGHQWNSGSASAEERSSCIPSASAGSGMGKICLITTCLNELAWLNGHIDALRKTCSVPELDFHIVDGGSSDGTATLMNQRLKPTEYSILPGSGIYSAWNHALSRASGFSYYCFLGVGDKLCPEGLTEAMALMASSSPDIIYGPTVTNNGKVVKPIRQEDIGRWRWGRLPFCHAGAMFSSALFNMAGSFDDSYEICGDLEWMLRARSALLRDDKPLSFGCTKKILAKMRRGGVSSDPEHLQTVIAETRRAHHTHKVPIGLKRNLYFMWQSGLNQLAAKS